MNYIMSGIAAFKSSILYGIFIYIVIFVILYIMKKERRSISWKNIFELIFCIYSIMILELTGIFHLHFSPGGFYNFNLIPFVGSSIIPVLLNFLLFVPYGFLLPIVFASHEWNWKRIVLIGALTSMAIEVLQLFGGRYAETDDFLINTFGTLAGYVTYNCIYGLRKNPKKACVSALKLFFAVIVVFLGVYVVGNNESELPDGLYAVENDISEIHVYCGGRMLEIEKDSYVYSFFKNQINNCGGHVLETGSIYGDEFWNESDCFIEVIYDAPKNIFFVNAEEFSIQSADRILYNADRNMLYWGNSTYEYCLDYTKMGDELQDHKEEILEGYKQLKDLIIECFR